MIATERIQKLTSTIDAAWLITPVICLLILLILPDKTSAEAYIYKDKDGVYRSAVKMPEEEKAKMTSAWTNDRSHDEAANEALHLKVTEFCQKSSNVESEALVYIYIAEAVEINRSISVSSLDYDTKNDLTLILHYCTDPLERSQLTFKKHDRSRENKRRESRMREKSFEDLTTLVKQGLKERTYSGVTLAREKFASPLDIQRMTNTLRYGMSCKDVRYLWGNPLWIYGSKGQPQSWRYPLGIALKFVDDKLVRWGTYN